jgi:DNA-binding transcriptional ArsR family regulator
MFIQGTVADIGSTAFTVYCCIKAHVDFNNGHSLPLQKDIVTQTGLSERQVQRSLKVLEKQGLLVRDKEGRKNVYRVKEKILLTGANMEGKNAILTWEHLPAQFKRARQELQALLNGALKSGKLITVEKPTTEKPVFFGDQVLGDKVLGDKIHITVAASEIDQIQDPVLRKKMEALLNSAAQKKAT